MNANLDMFTSSFNVRRAGEEFGYSISELRKLPYSRTFITAVSNNDIDTVQRLYESEDGRLYLQYRDDELGLPLEVAARNGFVDMAKYLIKVGADVNLTSKEAFRDSYRYAQLNRVYSGAETHGLYGDRSIKNYKLYGGQTPAYLAALNNHVPMLRCLQQAGADLTKHCMNGRSPMHAAASAGSLEAIRFLHDAGVDINIAASPIYRCGTPSYAAAQNNQMGALKLLHELGADLNKANEKGDCPIHVATQKGHIDVVRFLEAGADLSKPCVNGRSPMHAAASAGSLEVIRFLHVAGVDINKAASPIYRCGTPSYAAAQNNQMGALKLLHELGADLNKANEKGDCPIHVATQKGHIDVVRFLVDAGVELNVADQYCKRPIFVAFQSGHIEVLKVLLEKGADPNARLNGCEALIHDAVRRGNLEVVELLIDYGADLNIESDMKETAAYIAAEQGNVKLLRLLHSAGASLTKHTSSGLSCFKIAVIRDHVEVLKLLNETGVDMHSICARDAGLSTVHYAAKSRSNAALRYLVSLGVDLAGFASLAILAVQRDDLQMLRLFRNAGTDFNVRDGDGNTPLSIAVEDGKVEYVRYLREAGANINQSCKNGCSLLYLALKCRQAEIVTTLLSFAEIEVCRPVEDTLMYPKEFNTALALAKLVYPKLASLIEQVIDYKHRQALAALTGKSALQYKPFIEYIPPLSRSLLIDVSDITFEDRIAVGEYSDIYKGKWNTNSVALKHLQLNKLNDELLGDYMQEVKCMARLHRPNVVEHYGLVITPQREYYIVMSLYPKLSLYDVLKNDSPMTWKERYKIAVDIVNGLRNLHKEHIIHKDLRSKNVLLYSKLSPSLKGFATSKRKKKAYSYWTKSGEYLGSIPWMAPELFKQNPICTVASDVYSLGVVLWELATGELPYAAAKTYGQVKKWIQLGYVEEIPTDAPVEYAELIASCWDMDPASRPDLNTIESILYKRLYEGFTNNDSEGDDEESADVVCDLGVSLFD